MKETAEAEADAREAQRKLDAAAPDPAGKAWAKPHGASTAHKAPPHQAGGAYPAHKADPPAVAKVRTYKLVDGNNYLAHLDLPGPKSSNHKAKYLGQARTMDEAQNLARARPGGCYNGFVWVSPKYADGAGKAWHYVVYELLIRTDDLKERPEAGIFGGFPE